jgi:hypothetical protein
MIVSRDEFLLLAQKWINSSAQLRLVIAFGGKTSADPISSALIVKLSARILDLDVDASMLTCSIGEDGLISIGFEGGYFDFGTSMDSTVAALSVVDGQEIDEAVTVCLACGLNVAFLSFKS